MYKNYINELVSNIVTYFQSLREKYPNTEFLLVFIFLYSGWIQENMDQKKLRIWTFFTQWTIFLMLVETKLICWSTGPADPILSKNKEIILQNFGELAFLFNLLFFVFWNKKEIKHNKVI